MILFHRGEIRVIERSRLCFWLFDIIGHNSVNDSVEECPYLGWLLGGDEVHNDLGKGESRDYQFSPVAYNKFNHLYFDFGLDVR